MSMTLSTLAARLGLTLKGEDGEFTGLNSLEAATETEVSFLANPKYAHFLSQTKARAVIVSPEFQDHVTTALVGENPYQAFAGAAFLFQRKHGEFSGISPLASIDPTATLGLECTVYPFAFVGPRAAIGEGCVLFPGVYVGEDAVIGNNSILYPGAVVFAGVTLGESCVLNAGAVIGTDGFGFVRMDGKMQKIPQIGTVHLADRVDVGANACVDRATLGATRIGQDSKLDNLVQIGHNVTLGEQSLIIAQVGIAGSTKVGDRVTMAGQVGLAGHLNIGNDVVIGPQSGVPKDIADGVTGGGTPFVEGRTFLRVASIIPKLPELQRRVVSLEKELADIKALIAGSIEKENN